jgi:hypothetical protein
MLSQIFGAKKGRVPEQFKTQQRKPIYLSHVKLKPVTSNRLWQIRKWEFWRKSIKQIKLGDS